MPSWGHNLVLLSQIVHHLHAGQVRGQCLTLAATRSVALYLALVLAALIAERVGLKLRFVEPPQLRLVNLL